MNSQKLILDNTYQVHYVQIAPHDLDSLPDLEGRHVYIGENGVESWWEDGDFHRDEGPAYIKKNDQLGKEEIWYRYGQLHRDGDEPAMIQQDGSKSWHKNGELHREGDEPAEIDADGSRTWYKDGECHRDGDKPAVICSDGTKKWCKNDKLHRDGDKPAIIDVDGTEEWWTNDQRYRDPHIGPAVMYNDPNKEDQYWLDGKQLDSNETLNIRANYRIKPAKRE